MAAGALTGVALAAALVATAAGAAAGAAAGQPPARGEGEPRRVVLRWQAPADAAGRGEVRVAGLPAAALERLRAELDAAAGERLLRVVAAPAELTPEAATALPPLWGAWAVDDGELVFRPRHVPAAGTTLHARFDGRAFDALGGGRGTPDAALRLTLPRGASVAGVVGVSPGGDEVPQNLLRLYVEFSHPMSLRGVDRHVRLLRADGSEIVQAFASPADGLWDAGRRRLTLIVHPGRVKSGLALGDTLGPVLVEGETVALVVDAAARDADGRPLVDGFRRRWRVGPPRRKALDLQAWRLAPPRTSHDPLVATAPVALDRAVALRALAVVDAAGAAVAGELALAPGEREVRFAPAGEWRAGETYRLVAAAFLEDVSGNRPGRPFERAIGVASPGGATEVAFVPGGAAAAALPAAGVGGELR